MSGPISLLHSRHWILFKSYFYFPVLQYFTLTFNFFWIFMDEYVDHNWLSEQRTSKHNKFNGLHGEGALLSLNGLPPLLLRSEWLASEAEGGLNGLPPMPKRSQWFACLMRCTLVRMAKQLQEPSLYSFSSLFRGIIHLKSNSDLEVFIEDKKTFYDINISL